MDSVTSLLKRTSSMFASDLEHPGSFDSIILGEPYGDKHFSGEKGAKMTSKVHGIKMASAPGFYGKGCAGILAYDPHYTITSVAGFRVPHLSVFHCKRTWRRHALWCLYAIAVGLISAYSHRFPAEALRDPLERSSGEFRFLTAIVIGSFIGRAITAWKERRTNYGSLCGTARGLILALSTHLPMHQLGGKTSVPSPHQDEIDFRAVRERMGRYVVLALELAVLKGRGHMDSEEGLAHLQDQKLIQDGEWCAAAAQTLAAPARRPIPCNEASSSRVWRRVLSPCSRCAHAHREAMQPGDRHTTVLWWIMLQTKLLVVDGYLSKQEHITVVESTLAMRAQANDLMSCMPRDLPYPYASVVGALVNFVIFVQSTKVTAHPAALSAQPHGR